jgi:membrane-associated protein
MIDAILNWAAAHREYALWAVPLLAFMETCIGIGLFVPSLMLVIVCSVFHANDWANLWLMAGMALVGSSLGDHVGYYVGRAVGPRVEHSRLVQRNLGKWQRTEALVRRYGAWAIFIGRFIPAIRSLVPAMVGVTAFPRRLYTPIDVAACTLWALGLVGIVLGAHTLFLPEP